MFVTSIRWNEARMTIRFREVKFDVKDARNSSQITWAEVIYPKFRVGVHSCEFWWRVRETRWKSRIAENHSIAREIEQKCLLCKEWLFVMIAFDYLWEKETCLSYPVFMWIYLNFINRSWFLMKLTYLTISRLFSHDYFHLLMLSWPSFSPIGLMIIDFSSVT